METTELKQDEPTVEVIEHRSVDTMRNAIKNLVPEVGLGCTV